MPRPPRLLVLSASVGAGHLRAAQAVELALKELSPEATVRNLDVLELTNAAFRRVYGKLYLDLVNSVPHLLGHIYDQMDKPRRANSIRDRLRLELEKPWRWSGTSPSTRTSCRVISSRICAIRSASSYAS
jgi:processive 1,2-diacylglycerol beta-glucosyltransferase